MSYQVNWRVIVPDCEYWETEVLENLSGQIHGAIVQLITDTLGKRKQISLTSAEVVYLSK